MRDTCVPRLAELWHRVLTQLRSTQPLLCQLALSNIAAYVGTRGTPTIAIESTFSLKRIFTAIATFVVSRVEKCTPEAVGIYRVVLTISCLCG